MVVSGVDDALRCMSSSTILLVSTMVSGWCPFSNSAYLKACARLTNNPPNNPLFSWATQLPLLFRPMMTRLEPHDGGSSSFSTFSMAILLFDCSRRESDGARDRVRYRTDRI